METSVIVMENILKVLRVLGKIFTILTFYDIIFLIIGVFKTRKFAPAKTQHRFGFCIAARNEEKVIANLLESIDNQDYPKNKMHIYVVADNCTDKTAQVVEEFSAAHNLEITLIKHDNPNERRKGFALKYLFDHIKDNVKSELKQRLLKMQKMKNILLLMHFR